MNYFNKFPIISYDGKLAKNLLVRTKLSDSTKSNKLAYYPYTMTEEDRVDILANDYYDNPGYTWLVWMSNDIIDPYYGLPLSEQDFFNFITLKYGSFDKAMRKTFYYRVNWVDNQEEQLTISQYITLPGSHRKYYDPLLDNYGQVQSYKRKQDDQIASTNKIVALMVSGLTDTFTVGEELQVNGTNYAFCTSSSNTQVLVQHVVGQFVVGDIITGKESGLTATVETSSVLAETIPSGELVFWTLVSCFEYEQELNESKKNIQLLDAKYANKAEADLKRLMGQ